VQDEEQIFQWTDYYLNQAAFVLNKVVLKDPATWAEFEQLLINLVKSLVIVRFMIIKAA